MASIMESFNKADADTLGPDNTWVEDQGDIDVESNAAVAQLQNSISLARVASSLLDTINQSVSALVSCPGSLGDPSSGVVARKAASSTRTFYGFDVNWRTSAVRLIKSVAGTVSVLASGTHSVTPGVARTIRLEVEGTSTTSLRGYVDGELVLSFDDSSSPITEGLAVGIRGFRSTSGSRVTWDLFFAEDYTYEEPTMPNVLNTNPMVIDTAAASAVVTRMVAIMGFHWVPSDAVAAGDEVVVTDKDGNVIYHNNVGDNGTAADSHRAAAVMFPRPLTAHGLIIPTLDDGTLYIYLWE